MKRLEERVTCQGAAGTQYVVEVFRDVTRVLDNSQERGSREAFLQGDPQRPVKILSDEDTFEIVGRTTILHWVKDAF